MVLPGIVKVCEAVSANPEARIKNAKHLTTLINLTKQLNDSKYDSVVKPLYVKLKRVFYAKIAESDDWKAAVTNLQLQINAYGIQ